MRPERGFCRWPVPAALASESPVAQLTAFKISVYWLPICAMEPFRTAALDVRWQTSRAISGVSARVRRLLHHLQRLLNAFFGEQPQERRLFQLHFKTLAQRAVKNGVAGGIGEISKHHGVFFR